MDARKMSASERHTRHLSRGALAIAVTAVALALAVPGAAQARGSLRLFVDPPSPACEPEATFAGDCKFQFEMTVKIHQPKKCRSLPEGRDVKVSRIDPPFSNKLWNEVTVPRKRFTETIEADALSPGHELFPSDALKAIGGTKMTFRARAAKVHGYGGPLEGPFKCKKLKTRGITEVTVPTPPPPE
jgi:hypothetical protein